jgi:hypothetical protein
MRNSYRYEARHQELGSSIPKMSWRWFITLTTAASSCLPKPAADPVKIYKIIIQGALFFSFCHHRSVCCHVKKNYLRFLEPLSKFIKIESCNYITILAL